MDRDFFINAGFPPPQHLDSTMAMPFIGLNCVPEQSYLEPNSSVDQYTQFESALMNSGMSNDAFALRELIGKLGGAGNFPPSSSTAMAANPYDSRHGTPLSSLPQLHLSVLDHVSNSNLGNSVPLASISADPGFAERAAKFSCFGSRSFNGRRAPIGLNNGESRNRSVSPLMGNGKLPRVSSSPVLSQPQIEIRGNHGVLSGPEKKLSKLLGSGANSNEGSSVSEQITKTSNELNSRKRKGVSRGNPKEDVSNSAKEAGGDEDANAKRLKATENESVAKTEEEQQKEGSNEKPVDPIKDYIHVRARRGQATDSHSLAERVRREKIGERMKLLQDLVPGCNKVTGKALMLDEIINYVQSLQRQVEFLSMKLATVNPELDFDIVDTLPKDQKGSVVPQELYPLESSAAAAAAFYNHNHQSRQNVQQLHNSNFAIQLPSLDGFSASLPEFPSFCEDDLHSIVQMGFTQNTVNFPVPYQLSDMKAER